jgi:hypothetical protein
VDSKRLYLVGTPHQDIKRTVGWNITAKRATPMHLLLHDLLQLDTLVQVPGSTVLRTLANPDNGYQQYRASKIPCYPVPPNAMWCPSPHYLITLAAQLDASNPEHRVKVLAMLGGLRG